MGKTLKIVIADRLVIGNNHIVFNSGFISILADIFPGEDILFYSEESHAYVVKEEVGNNAKINYISHRESRLPFSKLSKFFLWGSKKIRDCYFVNSILKYSTVGVRALFFTTLSITSMFFANLRARAIAIPVYIVIHGEIEFLFKRELRYLDRIRRKIYFSFVRHLSSNVSLIVLSDVVRDALCEQVGIPREKLIRIHHPIALQEELSNVSYLDSSNLVFAHIGTAMKKKSSELFFKLAEAIKQKYPDPSIRFLLIGRIDQSILNGFTNSTELVLPNGGSIPQVLYKETIAQTSYSVFTFDEDNYVYRVSGAVIDTIAFAKPIIALKQKFFCNMFEMGGDIGFLCDSVEEMQYVIERIIDEDSDYISRYKMQCQNLRILSTLYSTDNIKAELENQLIKY